MNLRQLSNLVAVADSGSITRAAQLLNVSQPAMTRSIRDLERSLGVTLFDRGPRGITPTAYGETLIAHARTIHAELRRAVADLDSIRGIAAGHVRIGAAPLAAADLVPRALARLLAARPNINVTVEEGANRTLLPMLRRGDLDMVVGPLVSDAPETDFSEEVLFYNRLAIVARAGHALAGRTPLGFADLAGQQWILPTPLVTLREQLAQGFRMAGLAMPETAVATTSISCAKMLLLCSDRLTVLPPQLFRTETEQGLVAVLPVQWTLRSRPVGITVRTRGTLSPAARALIEHLRAELGAEMGDDDMSPGPGVLADHAGIEDG
jgi:LysR family transcriptional regulator, regulator for genes of the gallate degradation pathway